MSRKIGCCLSSNTGASRLASRRIGRLGLGIALGLLLAAAKTAHAEAGAERIAPGDTIDVQVWQEADLSGPLHVDADGTVSHVLLGRVAVGCKSCDELAEELRARLEHGYL